MPGGLKNVHSKTKATVNRTNNARRALTVALNKTLSNQLNTKHARTI